MFGGLLSSVVKVVTLPIDVAEITVDVLTGGDGSRSEIDMPLPSEIRDKACKLLKDTDDENTRSL